MVPTFAPNNAAYGSLFDTELLREFGLGCASKGIDATDLDYVLCFQFNARVEFTRAAESRWAVLDIAPFRYAIANIFKRCAGKQMRRTNAFRVVASVAYIKAIWHLDAISQFVRQPMRCELAHPDLDARVSVGEGSRPIDAPVVRGGFLNKFLKKLKAANLISHLSALHWRGCMALAALARCGATSILPPNLEVS